METLRSNGTVAYASSTDSGTTARALQPDYRSRAVQEALEHLASIDLIIELCNEAKVERCRATRDLRSCGRNVDYVLNSCGHASLCAECSQRCDLCPICRFQMPKSGNKLRLRLYCECIEAGLIPKRCDERFQEKEDGETRQTVDVQRLHSLFDVAIDNNLVSLICHYITDVCMDETAVSSDLVIAFLLDEVAVSSDPVASPTSNHGLFKDSANDLLPNRSVKRVQSGRDDRTWNVVPSDDYMDVSWNRGEGLAVDDMNVDGGPRWRSDEANENDEEQKQGMDFGAALQATPMTGMRKSRFARSQR